MSVLRQQVDGLLHTLLLFRQRGEPSGFLGDLVLRRVEFRVEGTSLRQQQRLLLLDIVDTVLLPEGFVAVGGLVQPLGVILPLRSEARRVGKEGVSTCRSRWSPNH